MADYVRLSPDDIRAVAAEFGLTARTGMRMPGGRTNSSYLVDCVEGRHVLTAYNTLGAPAAGRVNAVVRATAAAGLPVAVPLLTRTGSEVAPWRGFAVAARPYVEGSCSVDLAADRLATAGAVLAGIHLTPPPDGVPAGSRRLTAERLTELAGIAPPPLLREWHQRLRETHALEEADVAAGLLHGDYWPDNVVGTADGHVVPIDFEKTSIGRFVHDLGEALVSFSMHGGVFVPDRARRLLAGYESRRRLAPEERALLLPATVHAGAATAYERFVRYHVTFPEPAQQQAHLPLLAVVEQCIRTAPEWAVSSRDIKPNARLRRAEPGVRRSR